MRQYPPYRPPFSELSISDQLMTIFLYGMAVPAFLSSPYGLYYLVRGGIKYAFRKSDFKREIKRLERRGFVALTKTKNGLKIKLLKKGLQRQHQALFNNLRLKVSDEWDKKWRLLIFDIPEKQKNQRNLLRMRLKQLGMYNIQRSVFVYPYDCRDELYFVAEHYEVDEYTTYAEVVNIDIEKELLAHFDL